MQNAFLHIRNAAVRLCAALALFAVSITQTYAAAGDTFTVDDLVYTVNDDGTSVTLTDGLAVSGAITIPGTVTSDGTIYNVTAIGSAAFRNGTSYNNNPTSITVSEGITTIGSRAFMACYQLTSISLPETLETLGDSCFFSCTAMTEINFPGKLTTIPGHAFEGCKAMTSLSLPSTIISFETHAFANCTGLTSLSLSDGMPSVGQYAFYKCTGLTTLVIPDSVTFIERSAFQGCSGLKEIYLSKNLEYVDYYAFNASFTDSVHVYSYTKTPPGQKDKTGYVFLKSKSSVYGILHVPEGCTDAYTSSTYWTTPTYFLRIEDDIELEESSATEATLTVTAVEPEDEATVNSLKEMTFSVDATSAYVNEDSISKITVYAKTTGETYTVSSVTASGNQFTVTLTDTINAEGLWITVNIPEGLIGDTDAYTADFASGKINAAATFYFEVDANAVIGNGTVSVDPAEGAVDSLSTIKVTFEDMSVIGASWWAYPYLTDANGDVVYKWKFEDGDYEIPYDTKTWTGSNYCVLNIPTTITAAGTYTLVIPDSVFTFNDVADKVNEALSFTYTITAPDLVKDITIVTTDPLYDGLEGAAAIEQLSTIAIKFSTNVYVNPNATGNEYYDKWVNILNSSRELVATGTLSQETEGDSIVIVTLDSVFTEYGQYRMYLLDGAVGDATAKRWDFTGGSVNQSYNAIWFTVGSYDPGTYTLTPADGSTVEELSTFTLTYSDQEAIELSFADGAYPTLTDANGSTIYTWTLNGDQDVTENTLTLSLPTESIVTAPGTYTLTLPDSLLVFGGQWTIYGFSSKMTATYTIAGPSYDLVPTASTGAYLDDESIDWDNYPSSLETVTLTFDEPVYLSEGASATIADLVGDSSEVTLSQSEEGSTEVTLTIGSIPFDGYVTITVAKGSIGDATAKETSFVKGKQNADITLYAYYEKVYEASGSTVTVSPEEGIVESLSTITVTFADYIYAWPKENNKEYFYVLDADGNTVTTGTSKDKYTNYFDITLTETITAAGTYTLVLPAGTIDIMKNDWVTYSYVDTLTFEYVVGSLTADLEISSIDPAGSKSADYYAGSYTGIDAVSTITLTFDEPVYINPSVSQITFTNEVDNWYGTPAKSEDNDSAIIITLPATFDTGNTTYVLILEEGTFGDATANTYDFAIGKVNAADYIFFYIEEKAAPETGTVSIDPAEGTVESLSTFTLTFEDWSDSYILYNDMATSAPYLTDADGNSVATGTVGDDTYTNVATITLEETVTAAGSYTLVVPAGTFYLGAGYLYTNTDDLTFSYTIEEVTGINGITSNTLDADAPIYNLAGQRVSSSAKGILIQNGKKVIVK